MYPLTYALVAFVVCHLLLAWLLRYKAHLPLDYPNERSLHARPLPRVGGLGIVLGVLAAMLLLRPTGLGVLLGTALFLAALSWLDDLRGLSVRVRLPAHVLAAGVFLIFGSGMGALAWIPGILAVVWMTNLFNFMDGADGLAGGMAVAGFGIFGLAAWIGGGLEVGVVCLSVAAATLAFLRFNFPPARLFLGDSGSIPLGFLAAGLGWLGVRDGLWPSLFPVLVFSPFIVDATATLLIRLWRGDRVWQAHRSHYYQRLVRMGFGHRRLALLEYALMAAAALSGLALLLWPSLEWVLGVAWALFYLWAMLSIDQRWRKAGHAH